MGLAVVIQCTGLNLLVGYIFSFFAEIDLNANFGSILYAIAGLAGSLLSPFLLRLSFFDSRKGFIWGSILLAFSMAALSACIHFEKEYMTFAMIMIFQIVIQSTVCPLYYMYTP